MKQLYYLTILITCLCAACMKVDADHEPKVYVELTPDPSARMEVISEVFHTDGDHKYVRFYEVRVNGCVYLVATLSSGVAVTHEANCPNHLPDEPSIP